MSRESLSVAALSRPGRREVNEDAYGQCSVGSQWCSVLCDGAGGHGNGDVAAQRAVATILQAFETEPRASPQRVAELIGLGDAAVLQAQREVPAGSDMRTTIVVALVDTESGLAVWGHAGDSRLYRWRMGQLLDHTRDHSVQRNLFDAGLVAPGAAPEVSRSVLSSALGSPDGCDVDVVDAPLPLQDGDVLLLCSDGLWDTLDADTLTRSLNAVPSAPAWLAALDTAVRDSASPTQDNYTAIALWWEARLG